MGSSTPPHQPSASPAADARSAPEARFEPIVPFDFDGTLTVRDSFTAFLRWRRGTLAYVWEGRRLAGALRDYLRDRDRGRLKAQAVRVYLRGLPRAELDREARAFAELATPGLFRPDALAAWERHQRLGHRCVIVTASPEATVRPFAQALGAYDLLGTRLVFDAQDRVEGAFDGHNCRGEEKVRRLRERFGPNLKVWDAYGDTEGDREMLAMAQDPHYRVFTGRP